MPKFINTIFGDSAFNDPEVPRSLMGALLGLSVAAVVVAVCLIVRRYFF